ncbi:MAG TPA: serine/threonine-protein kinase, partial [Urbifossiella sp.]|nr:serine/threonine-protein kinase [Urbifossiella sp.]
AANQYKAYLDACEAGAWDRAAAALWAAVDLAPAAYTPFDRNRYTVVGILGGGAFGTVFHCLDEYARDEDENPTPVALKTFRGDKLGTDLGKVFKEAGTTKLLRHESIITVLDQGFGDPSNKARPYLVLEYFPGQSLDRYLAERGPLLVADFLAIARRVAEAVHAAHSRPRPVFHRDLKPANVMVRRNLDGTWAVKVIDFGLAVRGATIRTSLNVPQALRSTEDKSVTGTIKYAPPEQLGELPGVEVGPYSDVYAFGKTCLDTLFRHTQPDDDEWGEIPDPYRGPLKKLLTQCVRPALDGKFPRLKSFAPILDALTALDPTEAEARRQREREESEDRQRKEAALRQAAEAEQARLEAEARRAAELKLARQALADRERAERLELWKRSGQPQAWVERHLDGWDHSHFTALVADLTSSPYWPLTADEIGGVLDGLCDRLRADRDRRRQEEERQRQEARRRAEAERLAREAAEAEKKRQELPANPSPGDLFTARGWIPAPERRPGEVLTLAATIPAPGHAPGETSVVRWKAVAKRPNPNS